MRFKSLQEPAHATVGDEWLDPDGTNPRVKLADGIWKEVKSEYKPSDFEDEDDERKHETALQSGEGQGSDS